MGPFGTPKPAEEQGRCWQTTPTVALIQTDRGKDLMATTTLTAGRVRATVQAGYALPGVLLFLLAAQFMTAIMLAASIAPGYDMAGGAISDLGTYPETALLFNTSLMAVGLLNIAGGYAFFRIHGRRWILAVFVLAGVGATGAGLMPLNTSDLHGLFALVAFLFFNIEALACASLVAGPVRWLSVAAGLIGLAFVVMMVIGDSGNPAVFGPIGHGGAERMIAYPPMLWLMAFGGYLMGQRGAAD
jgi:hypothetical membrane protein